MRRLLLAALAALVLGAAAPAGGQTTPGAVCSEVSPVAVTCAGAGADKLAEFAKAECRGLSLPEAACRTSDGGWRVTRRTVNRRRARRACRRVGGRFATPRTGSENALLRRAAGRRTVRLRMRVGN